MMAAYDEIAVIQDGFRIDQIGDPVMDKDRDDRIGLFIDL
jgi:hypothetical protein